MLTRVALLLVLLLVPHASFAQVAGGAPAPRWDITGSAGLFAGRTPRSDDATGYQELWFQNVQGAVTLGRYLTRHLKLELEGSYTSGGTQFRESAVSVPGYPYPLFVGSDVTTSVGSAAAALTWQFADNEWVHPFIQAGLSADFDRRTMRTWEQFLPMAPGLPPRRVFEERFDGPETSRSVRALLGGGAKFYFSPRAFVRTDARWSFDRDRHNIALRAGLGIDF